MFTRTLFRTYMVPLVISFNLFIGNLVHKRLVMGRLRFLLDSRKKTCARRRPQLQVLALVQRPPVQQDPRSQLLPVVLFK